ncbi:hypothetical protein UlMin_007427 [Ulmus minor]
MSLVDYASSEDDDDVPEEFVGKQEKESDQPQPSIRPQNLSESNPKPESSVSAEPPSIEKLPDASELLNSPDFLCSALSGTDHSSRVAAAMAESASRKRDSFGLSSSNQRSKIPKGTLPHPKNVPDTSSGMLVPPQLRGRSNIVTEDISKLFVKKQVEPSSK